MLYAMLHEADVYVGALTQLLKAKDMWRSSLVVFSADNGGVISGVNYPLRGEKWRNYEGGVRVPAIVSSPLFPAGRRGARHDGLVHASDWLRTLVVGFAGGSDGAVAFSDAPTGS